MKTIIEEQRPGVWHLEWVLPDLFPRTPLKPIRYPEKKN